MIKGIGINFFHTHPRLEENLKNEGLLDDNHVVVDKEDYKKVLDYFLDEKIKIKEPISPLQIEINNKWFEFKHGEVKSSPSMTTKFYSLIIRLENLEDLVFFHKWESQNALKADVVKDFKFKTNLRTGVFVNCFPFLDKSEKFVNIIFDMEKYD